MPYYNHHIQSKLPKIGTTIFTTMSNLANDHGAINLSQGFPDFDVDERLKNLAIKSSTSNQKKIILDIKGPKEVKAKDITLVPEIEILNPEQVKSRISWLRQKLNSLGEINALAIEEFEEESKRLQFYEEQIDDLTKAEVQLLETIDEINTTATQRFNETFEEVRENFQRVFKTLFFADDFCDLVIEQDVEDPLEARIEIKAQPRGKRPSGISQLSGGEKTLTAIALLFAIYLVKPSPFCVLDEVDAPLDDANIERFAKMIKEFSTVTQFIIITHNKKTMSKAEMMYGVTMPETGVSRLVGVRMEDVA